MKRIIAVLVAVLLAFPAAALASEYTDMQIVKFAQQALNRAGYDCGVPDGQANARTVDAIIRYQAENGLSQTGVVDEALLASLGLEKARASMATVKAVQEALNEAGYDCGVPDGLAGIKTSANVARYQAANGLKETGLIDEALLASLGLTGAAPDEAAAPAEATGSAVPDEAPAPAETTESAAPAEAAESAQAPAIEEIADMASPLAGFSFDELYTDTQIIRFVQEALKEAGYDCGVPDGQAGAQTTDAVLRFQAANDLEPTGLIDENLLAALGLEKPLASMMTVKAIQEALNEAGYDCGVPDGLAGRMTAAAITRYQAANGLPKTGLMDEALLIALGLKGAPDAEGTPESDGPVETAPPAGEASFSIAVNRRVHETLIDWNGLALTLDGAFLDEDGLMSVRIGCVNGSGTPYEADWREGMTVNGAPVSNGAAADAACAALPADGTERALIYLFPNPDAESAAFTLALRPVVSDDGDSEPAFEIGPVSLTFEGDFTDLSDRERVALVWPRFGAETAAFSQIVEADGVAVSYLGAAVSGAGDDAAVTLSFVVMNNSDHPATIDLTEASVNGQPVEATPGGDAPAPVRPGRSGAVEFVIRGGAPEAMESLEFSLMIWGPSGDYACVGPFAVSFEE